MEVGSNPKLIYKLSIFGVNLSNIDRFRDCSFSMDLCELTQNKSKFERHPISSSSGLQGSCRFYGH